MTASGVEALADAVSAALGSMASALTLYPLDLVKTRLQAQLVGEHHDCRGGRGRRAQQGAAETSSEHNQGDGAPRGGVHAGDLSGNTPLARALLAPVPSAGGGRGEAKVSVLLEFSSTGAQQGAHYDGLVHGLVCMLRESGLVLLRADEWIGIGES